MHDLRRMSGWIAPDDKREICGRCGKPRSELCGDDFIPMSSAGTAKDDADARDAALLKAAHDWWECRGTYCDGDENHDKWLALQRAIAAEQKESAG